jgi:DNA repair photolyase
MKPIYKPTGRAKEYGDLAINIYTGCPHRCEYCFAPLVLKRDRETFHSVVEPRKGIVGAVKRQLEQDQITGKRIHLCFACDPYPAGIDTTVTREIIQVIKESGNHVQILTKGGSSALRDFDLLDSNDMFGVTYTGGSTVQKHIAPTPLEEPNAAPNLERLATLQTARDRGLNTWVSCEPVLVPSGVLDLIRVADYIDIFKIGKLNYAHSDIEWGSFGRACEQLCKAYGRNYYIKEDLRRAMAAQTEGDI